jgi:hypothetical protein
MIGGIGIFGDIICHMDIWKREYDVLSYFRIGCNGRLL